MLPPGIGVLSHQPWDGGTLSHTPLAGEKLGVPAQLVRG